MVSRGDVLRVKKRLGFSAKGEAESVVVVQATALNAVFPTLIVVPLDPATSAFAGHRAALRISRSEIGSGVDQVAIPWALRTIAADAFSPGTVGRLKPATLAALDDLIKFVLDLP